MTPSSLPSKPLAGAVERLQAILGYRFRQLSLLEQALTHRSYGAAHNERLEFLGDSVLNCAMAALLFARFEQCDEGDLSRLRARLVCQDGLHEVARQIDLGAALRLGEGELRSGGHRRPSILADALEAVLGAIFLDADFNVARDVVARLYAKNLAELSPDIKIRDAKSRLQEWLQSRQQALPEYTLVEVDGPQHAQRFVARCHVEAQQISKQGSGSSRRAAEQEAATAVLQALGLVGGAS